MGELANDGHFGVDIIKIVTAADTMQQQLENLRITDLLKRELDAPFLFLSGGECSLHRRLGMKLGCCMALCVYEHDARSTPMQPLLSTMKTIRDTINTLLLFVFRAVLYLYGLSVFSWNTTLN